MPDMMTIKQASEQWNLTTRRVAILCKEGQVPGARKEGHKWLLPADAVKPVDHRVKLGKYSKEKTDTLLPLPVGISSFREAVFHYYYVDKTLLIRDFLDERPKVSLFTRPRRFGKTLNMDMLRTFFEKTEEDTSVYFQDKKIWRCGAVYQKEQGKYPVVFLSFKDVKFDAWQDTLVKLAEIIGTEFMRHNELMDSPACNTVDKAYFSKVANRNAEPVELTSALLVLARMLHAHHKTAPILIIDEYDTPIQQGHMCGFYDQVVLFMRNLFSGGFKDNPHLSFGFLTGILRVAKESIFSGLNNLKINSILDNKYSEYFGFTPEEVKAMARYYKAVDHFDELCDWYDGYRFGKTDIFNPWSVINYFSNECQPRAFWVSTSSNDIIGEILKGAPADVYSSLDKLLQGKNLLTYIDTDVVYPRIRENPSSIYSFLLVTGYLKLVTSDASFSDGFMCEVALPNKEISYVYKKEILDQLTAIIPQSTAISIQEALYTGDIEALKTRLRTLLLQSASCFDTAHEQFYHGFMLGLTAMMDSRYYITSNRESGEGRYDLQLEPKEPSFPGIIIELKAMKDGKEEDLTALAQEALRQIRDKKYDMAMRSKGINTILQYGVAFSGKNVEVAQSSFE